MSRTKKSKQRRQRVKKQKKQHPYDKWVKLKRKIEDADVTRKTLIEKIAAFLQSVLPYDSTSIRQSIPDAREGLMAEAPDTASLSLPFLSRAHESVFASPIKRSLSMDSNEEGELVTSKAKQR